MSEEETRTTSDAMKETMAEEWDKLEETVEEEEDVEEGSEEEVEGEEAKEESGDAEVEPEGKEEVEEVEAEEAEPEEEAEEEVEDEAKYEAGTVPPLEHWSHEDKAQFVELPQEAQEFVVRKEKQFQAHVTRKLQDVADIKRALEPARAEMEQFGVSEGDAVRRLVGAHKMLQERPADGIRYLADTYGIDLNNLEAGAGSEDSAAMREVASIRETMAESERTRYQQNVAAWDVEIEKFKAEPGHELYSSLEPAMMRIAETCHARGEPIPSLKELYDTAAWSNPDTRAKLLEAEKATSQKTRLEKDKARARKAKRAAGTKVRSTSVASEKKDDVPATLRDALSDEYDKQAKATS